MSIIEFQNVSVDYPIYVLEAKRLRSKLLHKVTGGFFGENNQIRIVVEALKNISFTLKPGNRFGIVGPNGAGKTTLLQTAAGIYEPSTGSRIVQGRISALYSIGLGFDQEATGYENIRLRTMFMGMTPAQSRELFPAIEEFTELGDFLKLPIRTYSAGMKVRLAFAIATSVYPDILIMDEWLGAGDRSFKEKAKARMEEVVASSSILMLASHSERLIKDNCDKAMLLNRGEIIEISTVDDVYRSYQKLDKSLRKKLGKNVSP